MAIAEHTSSLHEAPGHDRRYVRPPQPVHFPGSEEMPETNRHLELRTALYIILKRELAARATIGSDQFVYYDPTTAKKKLAPDAFVKLDIPHRTFRVWKTWQRGAPDVAVEVVSDSDEGDEDWEVKLERYRATGIPEVVRFDPDDVERPIRVWDHVDGDLVERDHPGDGVFECVPLGLFWVAVPHRAFVQMLRLARDREGRDLLPTHEEAEREARRARQEEARARVEAERARAAAEQARDALEAEVLELRRLLAERAASDSPSRANELHPPAKPSRKAASPRKPAQKKRRS
jgi:Uma2 family endonuclease